MTQNSTHCVGSLKCVKRFTYLINIEYGKIFSLIFTSYTILFGDNLVWNCHPISFSLCRNETPTGLNFLKKLYKVSACIILFVCSRDRLFLRFFFSHEIWIRFFYWNAKVNNLDSDFLNDLRWWYQNRYTLSQLYFRPYLYIYINKGGLARVIATLIIENNTASIPTGNINKNSPVYSSHFITLCSSFSQIFPGTRWRILDGRLAHDALPIRRHDKQKGLHGRLQTHRRQRTTGRRGRILVGLRTLFTRLNFRILNIIVENKQELQIYLFPQWRYRERIEKVCRALDSRMIVVVNARPYGCRVSTLSFLITQQEYILFLSAMTLENAVVRVCLSEVCLWMCLWIYREQRHFNNGKALLERQEPTWKKRKRWTKRTNCRDVPFKKLLDNSIVL